VINEAVRIIGEILNTQLARRAFKAPAVADYVPLV